MATKRVAYRTALRATATAVMALLLCAIGWTLRGADGPPGASKSLDDLRKEKLADVKHWHDYMKAAYDAGTVSLTDCRDVYIALKDASLDVAKTKQERIAALKQYRKQMEPLAKSAEALNLANRRGGEDSTLWQTRYWLAQADTWIAEEEAKP